MNASFLALAVALWASSVCADTAQQVFEAAGVTGGLAVVVGSDPALLTALAQREGCLVQGLESDRARVATRREALRAKGVCSKASVKYWPADSLPFADGVVNLVVLADGKMRPRKEELERVLAPRGVAVEMRNGEVSVVYRRPVPPDIDEWSHYLHGPDNNAVAKDAVVGPPRHLKWTGGPKYSRNHEIDSSVVAVVSAGGRFFSVVDEGLPGFMGKSLPQAWALVARDAFSGVILWKRPMPGMGWPEWKPVMAQVDWTKLVAQRRLIPITLPRRVVASENRLFATLGYHAPLTVLDAATGKTLTTVDGTTGTDEILYDAGKLILCVRAQSRGSLDRQEDALKVVNRNDKLVTNHPGTVMAVDPESSTILWQVQSEGLVPLSLTSNGGRVFFHTGVELVCLDSTTGTQLWRTPNDNAKSFRWNVTETLVVHDDVLLLGTPARLQAFSAETGKLLWEGKGGRGGFAGANPINLYVIDGLVWTPAAGPNPQGRDLRTGEVKRTLDLPPCLYTPGHHIRCYRGKATERYLLENKRGIEMVDLQGNNFSKNDWVRGICRYGILPCNGMLYSTPTPCSCYPSALLTGFNALAASETSRDNRSVMPALERGPAIGDVPEGAAPLPGDWPCYRHDSQRSGATVVAVDVNARPTWETKLRGKLTQPIVAAGKVFVASVDEHTVYALAADSGEVEWHFTADARVDSPPTYDNGRLFFGCRNGWLYCLRAADGALCWRYRVAPADDQLVAYNQVESLWPVHGSALVLEGVVYAAAGRNSYLDGGLFLVGLDAITGNRVCEARLKNEPQDPTKDKGNPFVIDGYKLDLFSSDGAQLCLQGATFDRTLKRVTAARQQISLYASAGFLDDLAWNRNAWRCGWDASSLSLNKKNLAGMSHTGQLLVYDDERVYGVKYFLDHSGQSAVFYPGQKGYKLFAHRVSALRPATPTTPANKRRKTSGTSPAAAWENMLPVRIRAMTKAGDTLFVAGPPDVIDSADPLAALEGRKGALLRAYAAAEGKQLAELKLPSPPVFDGLIAANRKLFVSTKSSTVICLSG